MGELVEFEFQTVSEDIESEKIEIEEIDRELKEGVEIA